MYDISERTNKINIGMTFYQQIFSGWPANSLKGYVLNVIICLPKPNEDLLRG